VAGADQPGELIGSGRSADIYAIGPGRVLRRFRGDYDMRYEAEFMTHLGQAGFPVPVVYDASGSDLIMERLDGPDMLKDLARHPWRARRYGRVLAELHNQLHAIQAPVGARRLFDGGDRVLHLDFHPGNVMLTRRGPIVIDWTNGGAGPAGADVAMAYLIMASSEVDDLPWHVRPVVSAVRTRLITSFLAHVRDDPGPHIKIAAEARKRDRNVRPAEAARLDELVAQASQRAS
jgi:aminoglycoside phosphotransferase (APT) family kinase protein